MATPDLAAKVRLALEEYVESKLRQAFLTAGRRPSSAASTARILLPAVMDLVLEDATVTAGRGVLGAPR